MTQPAVKLSGVSKAFPLHRRKLKAGVETSVGAGLATLARTVWSGPPKVKTSDRNHLLALNDVSFDVAPGEVFGIIGRNGAGKSTLLKLLARVLQPTGGRIEVRGRVASLLELGLGMAEDMTVRQNIHLQGRLSGLSNAEVREAEQRILEFSGLERFRDVYLGACPSGSFIRLAFSTVINLNPDVILADEVLAVGDSAFRKACMERIRSVGARGETVLFVSHDMSAVKQLCTRTAWIDHGRLRMIGDTEEVVDAYVRELLSVREGAAGGRGPYRIADLQMLSPEGNPVGALEMTTGGQIQAIVALGEPPQRVVLEIGLHMNRKLVMRNVSPPLFAASARMLDVRWKIPPHFLNENRYGISARLVVVRPGEAPQPFGDKPLTLDFDVYNTRPEESVWADWEWGRSGALAPALDWTCTVASTGRTLARQQTP